MTKNILSLCVLGLLFGYIAVIWIEFTYQNSTDVGAGFYIFLFAAYLAYCWFASRWPFIPIRGMKKYAVIGFCGFAVFAAWTVLTILSGSLLTSWKAEPCASAHL